MVTTQMNAWACSCGVLSGRRAHRGGWIDIDGERDSVAPRRARRSRSRFRPRHGAPRQAPWRCDCAGLGRRSWACAHCRRLCSQLLQGSKRVGTLGAATSSTARFPEAISLANAVRNRMVRRARAGIAPDCCVNERVAHSGCGQARRRLCHHSCTTCPQASKSLTCTSHIPPPYIRRHISMKCSSGLWRRKMLIGSMLTAPWPEISAVII